MADVHVDADGSPEHRQPPVTPDARHHQAHDAAGESSSTGSRSARSSHSGTPDLTHERLMLHQSSLATQQADEPTRHGTTRRKRRDRPNASFLLDGGGVKRSHSSRLPKPSTAAAHVRATTDSPSNTTDSTRSIALRDTAMRVVSDPFVGKVPTLSPEAANNLSTSSLNQSSPASSQNSQAQASVDADSTQIVNMALNLSESRRLVSRRNVSRAAPPKLLPLPDSATTNDLRQQLKQQRRSSRNISPRPGPSMIPRQSTGLSVSSPLHSNFHAGQDDMHRYHFSISTLARAQKAKDQLELMAQYRRLLDVLPPLKPAHLRTITTSPPASPAGGAKAFTWSSTANPVQLGRKYNPLQYIRNRKVRARERKIIDGERQGFGEIDSVKSWVGKCEQNVALQQSEDDAGCMVPFSGAEQSAALFVPDPAAKAARTRRPRVDWFVEPCDMIADAYWIEQDQNRDLIEDRHWRKIFPPKSELSRPMSRDNEEPRHVVPFSPDAVNRYPGLPDIHHVHRNHGPEHGRQHTIDRARERLHQMKDANHWHVSGHLHGRPHSKKDSASEYSESDTEARNRTIRDSRKQAETKAAQPGDILHKQMLEMIAKENIDKDVSELAGVENFVPPTMTSPERNVRSKPGSRLHSRKGSIMDISDHEPRGTFERMHKISPSRFRPEDQAVEGHQLRAPRSIDNDSSLPTSPELRPSRKTTLESAPMELPAPWSRSGSPSKNQTANTHTTPEAKLGRDKNADTANRADTMPREAGGYSLPLDAEPSLARNSSAPLAGDTIKGHRRMGSLLHRADDPNSGLRGIFKGPRIDTVLRGGVSRIGDILRKKDGSGEFPEIDSTDESDSERNRGRRPSPPLSRRPSKKDQLKKQDSKHFLDVMPQFQHAPGASTESDIHKSASWAGGVVQSSESSRVDLLKPPQTGLRSSSMSTSPSRKVAGRPGESDISEAESLKGRVPAGVREADRRLSAILGDSAARRLDRSERTKSRQWSIADQGSRQVEQSHLSRREMARVKTLVLSTGIKAMEINRRAQETHKPFSNDGLKPCSKLANIDWDGFARMCPENRHLHNQDVPFVDVYPLAAQTLASTIQAFGQRWQMAADKFTSHTGPELHRRVGAVRSRVADDLAPLTRGAVEEADEASRSLALDQPLRIKHVVDTIEKMLRKRRRRLRWVRRGLWLSVEWLLVGFMWYVWFVVMILRVFLGIGKGLWHGVKWVLWLA